MTAFGTSSKDGTPNYISGSSVVINPSDDLVAGTDYYLQIDATAIDDTTGGSYAGIRDTTTLNFTAINTAPTLDSSDPIDDGSLDSTLDINLSFSEYVYAGSGNISLYLTEGTLVESFDVSTGAGTDSGNITFSNNLVTINPGSDLTPDSGYYLNIDATAVEDSLGVTYVGIANDLDLNFFAI